MSSPQHHRVTGRSLLPLALALILVGVMAAAAFRGDGDSAASVGTSTPTPADTAADPTPPGEVTPGVDETPTSVPDDGQTDPTPAPTTALPTATPPRPIEGLPLSGPGTFTYAPAGDGGYGTAPYRAFNVATEDGTGVDPNELATFVDSVLSDTRSWIGDGKEGFQRVAEGDDVLFTIVVATPETVDELCLPLVTESTYSCGNNGYIALNLYRWETAVEDWPDTLDVYRHYLVNHEVGHYILGPYHDNVCAEEGSPAPIMMQQSIDLHGCVPNGWVYPANT